MIRLVEQGVYKPVAYSAWAAPIVPLKIDSCGRRICGDYSLAANRATVYEDYQVPKTEDLLATLNGGKKSAN